MNNQKKVNIYELAKATGFSTSTISKALNNTGRISEKTKKVILEKAREMNYVGSYYAKALSSSKSWIIGIIYSDNLGIGFSHPHFSVILESFKREAESKGYEITFINRNMGNQEMSYLEFCRYRNVEGVFIVNFYSLSKQLPELIESGIPIVTADQGSLNITTITSDDITGGQLAAKYLLDLGHKEDVFHIAGPLYTVSAQHRLQGFKEVMEENNVTYKIYEADNFGFEDGYNQAKKIIEDGVIPSAIFVAGDWIALGAIKAFKEHGIDVPNDVSIIGYDNLDFLQYSSPALTTVSQNKQEIGSTAAKYLIKKINGETVESTKVDVKIIERETCIKKK